MVAPNGKIGQQTSITDVVSDENGNSLANVQLVVTVDGVSRNVVIGTAGIWNLDVIPDVSGNLIVVVSWVGNGTYNGFSNFTVFVVVNTGSNSIIITNNMRVGQNNKINGISTDEYDNSLAGVVLELLLWHYSKCYNTY